MGSPQQGISPSKESRSRPIRNSKTQENQDLPTAFLQNRILARVKSQRQINRFRILHGRLRKYFAICFGCFVRITAIWRESATVVMIRSITFGSRPGRKGSAIEPTQSRL